MHRRRFLGVLGAAALAGCNGFLSSEEGETTAAPTRTEPYGLAVDYDGPWQAELEIGLEGGTERRGVGGDGPERVSISADAHRLEAWVEKLDGRDGILTIRLHDGEDVLVRSSIGDEGSETGIDTSL